MGWKANEPDFLEMGGCTFPCSFHIRHDANRVECEMKHGNGHHPAAPRPGVSTHMLARSKSPSSQFKQPLQSNPTLQT